MILLYHLLTHLSILNRIYFDSTAKQKAPASPIKGRRSNESPRQIATPRPMPRRAYKRGNPHGGQRPELASSSAGDCTERTHLWPRLAPRADNCPGSTRGGPPASRPPTSPLYYKNSLRLSRKWCRIVAPRQIKGRAQGATNTLRPYAGGSSSHTTV